MIDTSHFGRPRLTNEEALGPAMLIADQADAEHYFAAYVAWYMRGGGTRQAAERVCRANLGYYAGCYDDATRRRVERLFLCTHPIFGPIDQPGQPTAEAVRAARAGWPTQEHRTLSP